MNRLMLLILCMGLVMSNNYLALGLESEYVDSGITFCTVSHATFVIQTKNITIYVDPVGSIELFNVFSRPEIILITDIHGDHLDAELINAVKQEDTITVGPEAAIEQLGFGEVISNTENKLYKAINFEAIPMYNLTSERQQFHPKGRGNGYVITLNDKRIYISGDTEDIKELRQLKNIDYAFVCMNLPYTMTVEQAASAVLEFKPKVVLPYHYRGQGMMSDVNKFKEIVSQDTQIEVVLLKWY